MAYRFQDLEGNWRMRFEDGSTSLPIDPSTLSPSEQTSTLDGQDPSGQWRQSYGIDNSFATSKAALNFSRDPSRMAVYKYAIIDSEMSKNRVAQFTAEFKPLAEMAATQDALITNVASNAVADPEMRAAAFQALYPGMQVTVNDQGNLSFSAMHSDLGFQYPDKEKATRQQILQSDPNLAKTGHADTMTVLNDAILGVQSAVDPSAMGDVMGQAATALANYKSAKRAEFEVSKAAQYPLARLRDDLQASKANDAYYRNLHAAKGEYVPEESDGTTQLRQRLTAVEAQFNADVAQSIADSPEAQQIDAKYATLMEVYKSAMGRQLQAPALLPDGVHENYSEVWNKDGVPMTPQQRDELSAKIAANDPYALTLVQAAQDGLTGMLASLEQVGAAYAPILKRAVDRQTEAGFTDRVQSDLNNFEAFLGQNNIKLTEGELATLAAGASIPDAKWSSDQQKAYSRLANDPQGKEAAIKAAAALKVNKLTKVYREARDMAHEKAIVQSSAVPADDRAAEYFQLAVKFTAEEALKAAVNLKVPEHWYSTTESIESRRAKAEADFRANPETMPTPTLAAVLTKMGSYILTDADFQGDSALEFSAAQQLIKTMEDWLRPQLEAAPMKSLLGSVQSLPQQQIAGYIQAGITNAQTQRAADRLDAAFGTTAWVFGYPR